MKINIQFIITQHGTGKILYFKKSEIEEYELTQIGNKILEFKKCYQDADIVVKCV